MHAEVAGACHSLIPIRVRLVVPMKLDEVNLLDLDLFVNGDPHQALAVLRHEAPLYWHERQNGRGFWAVTRYRDALRVYHEPETYSSERGISLTFDNVMPEQVGSGMMMILTDRPARRSKPSFLS
jgi:cytochrome P450